MSPFKYANDSANGTSNYCLFKMLVVMLTRVPSTVYLLKMPVMFPRAPPTLLPI